MKKLFILSVSLLSMAVVLSECKTTKTTKTTTTTTTTTVPTAPAAPSAAEMVDINAGELFFTTKCDGCHRQPGVRKHDDAGWAQTMASMGPKAQLTDFQTSQVLKYLHSANSK